MPILYKLIPGFLALTGCISILVTGELIPFMAISGIAFFFGYYRFLRGYPPAPRWVVGTFSVATLIVFVFDSLHISGDFFIAVAHLTIAFQAIKSFDLKEPWDHLQVYCVSLLQLIIASELTSSLIFGIIFIVFMVMLVTAMVFSHFLKEKAVGSISLVNPVMVISFLTLIATVVTFVLLPRTPLRFFGKSHVRGMRTVGFSERVDFGSLGNIKLDPSVVMRIEISRDKTTPYYWRGIALDYFDGVSWRDSGRSQLRVQKSGDEFILFPYNKETAIEQKIYMEPIDSTIIFGLSDVGGIKTDLFSLMVDENQSISIPRKSGRRIAYTAYSITGDSQFAPRWPQRYLQVPGNTGRIKGLAAEITRGISDQGASALAIEQYLKKNFTYSLNVAPPPEGTNPVDDFLFSTRKGFCEHYATSMVLMLRNIGIPSRIVNGFLGGQWNEYSGYLMVRQSDAHSWVEALINGKWRRFDPTPPVPPSRLPGIVATLFDSVQHGWSRYVVGFSFVDQQDLINRLGSLYSLFRIPSLPAVKTRLLLTALASLTAFVFLVVLALRHLRFRRHDFVTREYLLLREMLRKKGFSMSPNITPGEIRMQMLSSSLCQDLDSFLSLYEIHRFGRKVMPPDMRLEYSSLLGRIRKRLKHLKL